MTVENPEMVLATAVCLAATVENQRRLVSTVVFEYFLAQITVAGAGFVGYDCHQAMKKHQKLQYLKDFFLLLLSV